MPEQRQGIELWSSGALSTDTPLFFKIPKENEESPILKNLSNGELVQLTTQLQDNFRMGEFRVSIPGDYQILVGKESKQFHVKTYERFSFGFELGLTALAVAIFFIFGLQSIRKRWGAHGQ